MTDYKKLYEDANKKVATRFGSDVARELFPEFYESEDEKIRKELMDFVVGNTICKDGRREKYLAWLEKQGGITKLSEEEQNKFAKGVLTSCALSFINYLDAHKYNGKMCVSNGECEDIENAFHNAMWDRLHRYYCKYIEKQDEQLSQSKVTKISEHAWSKEDEHRVEDTIYFLETAKKHYASDVELNACIDWLKSLKDRIIK